MYLTSKNGSTFLDPWNMFVLTRLTSPSAVLSHSLNMERSGLPVQMLAVLGDHTYEYLVMKSLVCQFV